MKKIIHSVLFILVALATSCGGGGGESVIAENGNFTEIASNNVQGKLAQGYVRGAQVWYDLLDSSSQNNFQRDPGESDTLSGLDGSYSLMKSEKEGLLVSFGGNYLNSKGEEIPAAPMLAPKPDPNQTFYNLTPITTLVAAAPNLKFTIGKFGDWNSDIANSNGVSAPLLRLAKIVESFSGILGKGNNPIVLNDIAQLRSIILLADQLNTLSLEELDSASDLKAASSAALDQVFEDKTLTRAVNDLVKNQIHTSIADLVDTITITIPGADKVVEGDVVAQIEKAQEENQASVQAVLDEQVTITLGGFGIEFDPIITSIKLEAINDKLFLSAEVSDERPNTLSYRWTTNPQISLINPFSAEAQFDDFDYSSLSVILRVVDDTEIYTTEVCAWDNESNPKICSFIGD